MSQITVRITVGGDEVAIPLAQALTLGRLSQDHPGSTWHFANCGCCVCFHPDRGDPGGWLIGADGEAEFVRAVDV